MEKQIEEARSRLEELTEIVEEMRKIEESNEKLIRELEKQAELLNDPSLRIYAIDTSFKSTQCYGSLQYDHGVNIMSLKLKDGQSLHYPISSQPFGSVEPICELLDAKQGRNNIVVCLGCSNSGKTFSIRSGPLNMVRFFCTRLQPVKIELIEYFISDFERGKEPNCLWKGVIGNEKELNDFLKKCDSLVATKNNKINSKSTRSSFLFGITPCNPREDSIFIVDYPGYQPLAGKQSKDINCLYRELVNYIDFEMSGKSKTMTSKYLMPKKIQFRSNQMILKKIRDQANVTMIVHLALSSQSKLSEIKLLDDFSQIIRKDTKSAK